MTSERISEEFENWIVKQSNDDEKTFAKKYVGSYPAMGFYAGSIIFERLAKIEALEEVSRMMDKLRFFSEIDRKDAKDRIETMIAEIRDNQ